MPVIQAPNNNFVTPWTQYWQSLDKSFRGLTPAGSSGDAVSITRFPGVDLTGAAASGAAFNAAIAQVAAAGGGSITIPGGSTIALDQTLGIGNGSSGVLSTEQGVRIVGMGVPSTAGGSVGLPTATPVTFKWIGPANTPVVQVNGPLAGWGIENILIDGQSVAGVTGLNVLGGQNGDIRFLTFRGCFNGVVLNTQAGFSTAVANAMHNVFYACTVLNPSISGTVAIRLTGNNVGNANSAFNTFFGTTIIGTSVTTSGFVENGLYFENCDTNHFFATHMYNGASSPAVSTAVTFDYTGITTGTAIGTFPSGNYLDGIDPSGWTTTFANAPGTGIKSDSRANYVRPYEANQAVVPALDNLVNMNDSAQFPPWTIGQGTGDAIVAEYAQTFNNIPDGKLLYVRAPSANTIPVPPATTPIPTINVQYRGASALDVGIVKKGGQVLAPGDIHGAGHELVLRFNLAKNWCELLNPAT